MNFIVDETEQKLRGGYYTPLDLATYIASWTVAKDSQKILEPSCGDGIFIAALAEIGRTDSVNFTGFELLEKEAAKARARAKELKLSKSKIYGEDFLQWAIPRIEKKEQIFDSVVGNPPFIRYQYLSQTAQSNAEHMFRLLGLPFTKHTNAWVPFVLASIALLKPGGRLGMILPSEIVHVMHAQSLRTYLGESCSRLLIVDPEEIWFENTLQGAVILLAEKKVDILKKTQGLGIVSVRGKSFLKADSNSLFDKTALLNGKTVVGKWTKALLNQSERTLLDELEDDSNIFRFKDIAEVDVGIVTGANKFFLVDDETVSRYKLQKYAHPMFGRSEHCPGIIYDNAQHQENKAKENPTNFIWFDRPIPSSSKFVNEYIKLGEAQKLQDRYKCRIRKPWYKVPSVYSTEIGMLKRSHDTPRLIHNRIGALTTDTAYRIKSTVYGSERLIFSFVNPLTALSAELEGRHYGGGVLELVPSEIEKLLIPIMAGKTPSLGRLDKLVKSSRSQDVLAAQSEAVLGSIGVSRQKQEELLAAWLRLKNRRQRIGDE